VIREALGGAQALEKLQRRAVILKSTNVQLHCRYTLSLLFGLATERRRAWEAGWDLGRRLAAGELNCPSSSSSSSIVSLSLSTTQSFPDHYCLGNFSKFFFAQATLSSCPTRTFSQRRPLLSTSTRAPRRAVAVPPTPFQSRTKTIARTLTPARPRLLRFVHMAGLGGPF